MRHSQQTSSGKMAEKQYFWGPSLALLRSIFLLPLACAAVLGGCGPKEAPTALTAIAQATTASTPFYATVFEKKATASTLTALGRTLFVDAALSASGKLSCASCHSPSHAYGPPNGRSVQVGGSSLNLSGLRAVPSLMYQQSVPPFSEHFSETDGDDSTDQGPTGGRTWDGRASSAHEQAILPLLSSLEMANTDIASVVAHLRASPSAEPFRQAFGDHVLEDETLAWRGLLLALEVFQQNPSDFYPYTSKYDAFLRQKTVLSPSEMRGFTVFNDRSKGNCAACHPGDIKRGAFPSFTDYGFVALGVPRNMAIPANVQALWNDKGLCGPLRTDFKDQSRYCGLFRTPGLRNVALRRTFFHNGVIHSLEDAIRFYALRDVQPNRFYPRKADGQADKFNDLPLYYHGNVNTESPFGGKPGDQPRLTEADIHDVAAFLKTLNDGYKAPH